MDPLTEEGVQELRDERGICAVYGFPDRVGDPIRARGGRRGGPGQHKLHLGRVYVLVVVFNGVMVPGREGHHRTGEEGFDHSVPSGRRAVQIREGGNAQRIASK